MKVTWIYYALIAHIYLIFLTLGVVVTRWRFEWDPEKAQENLEKHGVSFDQAQHAFADPHRIIEMDTTHSQEEPRFFCYGAVDGRILTVRFTPRIGNIRIFGAAYWRKGKKRYEQEA